MRIGLLTALWKRPELTDLVLRYYADVQIPDLVRVAVHSEPELPAGPILARTHPLWRFYYWPNKPLGTKWNVGLAMLRQDDIDAVLIIGSDDLVSAEYIRHVSALIEKGIDYITLKDIYIFDALKQRLVYAHYTCGAGRVVSRRVLEALNWKLWDDKANSMLDSSLGHSVNRFQGLRNHHQRGNHAVVDIKTDVNMWRLEGDMLVGPTEQKLYRVKEMEPAPFLREHFPGVAEALLDWNR